MSLLYVVLCAILYAQACNHISQTTVPYRKGIAILAYAYLFLRKYDIISVVGGKLQHIYSW